MMKDVKQWKTTELYKKVEENFTLKKVNSLFHLQLILSAAKGNLEGQEVLALSKYLL
jgi:hypothetical protein